MYVAREIVEENGSEGNDQGKDASSEDRPEPEQEEPYGGSQYTSDMEEMEPNDELQDYSTDEDAYVHLHLLNSVMILSLR